MTITDNVEYFVNKCGGNPINTSLLKRTRLKVDGKCWLPCVQSPPPFRKKSEKRACSDFFLRGEVGCTHASAGKMPSF